MKIIILDQDEFDTPDSEEFLIMAIGHHNYYDSLEAFYPTTFSEKSFMERRNPNMWPTVKIGAAQNTGMIRDYLLTFAGINTIGSEPLTILNEQWNDQDYLIDSGYHFIRFYWYTTA